MKRRSLLTQGAAALDLPLPADAQGRLLCYLELLERWNRVFNLTAVRDPERMVTAHLLDCLAVVPHLPPGTLADVGSGAGLPGIPLAVARPESRITLVETNQKKVAFLRQTVAELGLGNVTLYDGRVEDWDSAEIRDAVISRAFSPLGEFLRLTETRVVPGGTWLAMKGTHPQQELEKIPQGYEVEVIPLRVPGLQAERHLVKLKRLGQPRSRP